MKKIVLILKSLVLSAALVGYAHAGVDPSWRAQSRVTRSADSRSGAARTPGNTRNNS